MFIVNLCSGVILVEWEHLNGRFDVGVIPVSLYSPPGHLVAIEARLEIVEYSKIVLSHDVRVRFLLHLVPD